MTVNGTRPLDGRVAVVSGASRGVGRTYALALAEAGAQVVGLARSVEGDPTRIGSLSEVVATARAKGLEVTALGCDLNDETSVVGVIEHMIAKLGGVDVLVNNAIWPTKRHDPLAVPRDEWLGTMNVNVRAVYALAREVIPHMIERGGGSIVNITSGSASVTAPGQGAHDGLLVYGVSKAALNRLTAYLAAELADRHVAVNAVSPGHVSRYIQSGREPDRRFWGDPIVHLAQQRPPDGMTGAILHTYEFGRSWGPIPATRPDWDEEITAMLDDSAELRNAGITD